MPHLEHPKITIIIPCRNEQFHIKKVISSLFAQKGVEASIEIIIADGRSEDGTREILNQMSTGDPRLRIIDNPGMIVSTGLNAAIRAARGDIVIRMDAHTECAQDYVKQCVHTLESTGADNVGGPWRAIGLSWLQKAIALSFQSPFSSGGAGSHRIAYEGLVDTVYLGCWHKDTLFRLGLFDEELIRNQDDEFNLRLLRSGGKIWQSPTIRSWYYPRSSLANLFKQYVQYGYWKVRVIQKHKLPASFRHLVPGIFVTILLALSFSSIFFSSTLLLLLGILSLYFFANFGASLLTCRRMVNWRYLLVMPFVFATYHFGYGWGFLKGVIDFFALKRSGRDAYRKLTR
jgi:succinoglycan biosynthesis protein ExoA